jgi:N-acetylmuramoyl-L-alanine amidase
MPAPVQTGAQTGIQTGTQAGTQTAATVDFPILRVGMRGAAVSGLQARLQAIGVFGGAIDGIFGTETQEAVKAAQQKFNLESDGVVGSATWAALMQ